MTKEEMILALDRISRFKYPEKKLKRVYVETICAHLISNNLKKSDVEIFNNSVLTDKFTEIWNYSIEYNYKTLNNDYSLNENYINEEKKCYKLNDEILDLMPKLADFKTLVLNIKDIPNNFDNYKTPRKIVLTEGVTEEILLPEFSKVIGYDWGKNGVKIVGTGGKSRIISQYNIFKNQLNIPVYVLMDNDAASVYNQLFLSLRKIDAAHLISAGEIEDIIPVNLFKNAINSEYKLQSKISVNDFDNTISMVKNLHNIFKNNGFGEFKKAKTANLVKNIITSKTKLSDELAIILEEIKKL